MLKDAFSMALNAYHQNDPTLVRRLEAKIYEYLAHEELI